MYYRGSLSSCNYACGYCPFAKTSNTRAELLCDQEELERFVAWVAACNDVEMSLLFTPWGEALVHRYYRQALVELSRLKSVRRVCIQTNLSAPVDDLDRADKKSLTLWATYHPGEVRRSRFVARCRRLQELGIRYSVGVVGMKEHLEELEALRRELPREVYLWVNAYKRVADYYESDDLRRIRNVDPHFDLNNQRYASLGRSCKAGSTHFTVDGAGDMRRCHFVGAVLGNIYRPGWLETLKPRFCPVESCGCYIGYIHLPELGLENLYGNELLGRIPREWSSGGVGNRRFDGNLEQATPR